MAKYSYEFKKKLVMEYLNGEGGYKYIANLNGMPSSSPLKSWVSAYNSLGDEGLMRSRKNKNYTFEYKLNVVELYLTSEISYQELAVSLGINNPPLITRWVNDYRTAGPDALRPKKRGRKELIKTKIQPVKAKENKDNKNTNAEYLKELEDENLRLRIEIAYLKELRRLRLEEEALLKKQRELYTVSEENLD